MKRTTLIFAFASLCWSPLLASDRLTDKDVKSLVARIEQGRDRFDDTLDDKIKRSIVRGPTGEVDVDHFLNDFQESIDRLEERLKPEYAASAEAATLLRQASIIDGFFRQHPGGTKGESEWNRLATDLKTLARAYGAEFPLAADAAVRRIGDRELAAAVEEVGRAASQVKQSLDSDLKVDTTVNASTREAVVGEADALSKDAKALRKKVKDGKPSSAEAEQLLTGAAKLQSFIGRHQVPRAAATWASAGAHLESVASAYGTPWPRAR